MMSEHVSMARDWADGSDDFAPLVDQEMVEELSEEILMVGYVSFVRFGLVDMMELAIA